MYDFHARDFIHRVYHDDSGRPRGQKKDKKDVNQLVKECSFIMKEQMEEQRNYFEKEFDKARKKYQGSLEDLARLRE